MRGRGGCALSDLNFKRLELPVSAHGAARAVYLGVQRDVRSDGNCDALQLVHSDIWNKQRGPAEE